MKSKDIVIDYFNQKEEVKRIKELENYIDNNKEIKEKYNELIDLQKKIISSKEFNQLKQYKMYLTIYEEKKNEFFELPFVWEYMENINYIKGELDDFRVLLESKIKKEVD